MIKDEGLQAAYTVAHELGKPGCVEACCITQEGADTSRPRAAQILRKRPLSHFTIHYLFLVFLSIRQTDTVLDTAKSIQYCPRPLSEVAWKCPDMKQMLREGHDTVHKLSSEARGPPH